jgi:hypothetical protein
LSLALAAIEYLIIFKSDTKNIPCQLKYKRKKEINVHYLMLLCPDHTGQSKVSILPYICTKADIVKLAGINVKSPCCKSVYKWFWNEISDQEIILAGF